MTRQKTPTTRWHRHRWTQWGEPFTAQDEILRGVAAAGYTVNNFQGAPIAAWQERRCGRCNRAERRRIV